VIAGLAVRGSTALAQENPGAKAHPTIISQYLWESHMAWQYPSSIITINTIALNLGSTDSAFIDEDVLINRIETTPY
jgi:hypothetical protein